MVCCCTASLTSSSRLTYALLEVLGLSAQVQRKSLFTDTTFLQFEPGPTPTSTRLCFAGEIAEDCSHRMRRDFSNGCVWRAVVGLDLEIVRGLGNLCRAHG